MGSTKPKDAEGAAADAPRIALPRNLAQTLKYVSDEDLEVLRRDVAAEIERRRPSGAGAAGKPNASARNKELADLGVPEGKARLIEASYKAGVKPAAIARMLQLSQSTVNRVLSALSRR